MDKNNSFWIVVTLVVLVVGVGGYAVLAERGIFSSLSTSNTAIENSTTTQPTSIVPLAETKPVVANTETPPPLIAPPSVIFSIKEVYDTTVAPPIRSDEPRSGTKEITIRGKFRVIKAEIFCITEPCPQPGTSEYRFEFQDTYEPNTYKLSVRKTGDPVVKDLTDGKVYVVKGTLNYNFSGAGKATLSFDPSTTIQ